MTGDNSYADRQLIEAIAEGDTEAFRTFFVHYSPIIQRWVRQLLKNETAVMEVLQEVFIEIWLYRAKLNEVNNMMPWLKTVTSHQCFKYLKKQKTFLTRNNDYASSILASNTDYFAAEQDLRYKEVQNIVQKVLSSLTPQQQKIYHLSREKELDSAAIANELGISRGHVRNTISNILEHIREHLTRYDTGN